MRGRQAASFPASAAAGSGLMLSQHSVLILPACPSRNTGTGTCLCHAPAKPPPQAAGAEPIATAAAAAGTGHAPVGGRRQPSREQGEIGEGRNHPVTPGDCTAALGCRKGSAQR